MAPTPSWRTLHRTADRYIPRFTGPFVASIAALQRRVTLAALEECVERGELTRQVAERIDGVRLAKAAEPATQTARVYAELMAGTVVDMADYVESRWGEPGLAVALRFDVTSPQVLRAANELTANLIRGVGEETKMAVRRLIFQAVRDGVAPRDAARLIRQVLGLTERQALAVDRLRAGLIESGRDVATVDGQVDRYARKLLSDRALTVARTETMLAANRGQQLLWQDMQNAGILPMDFGQRWLVTPDDRLCSRCAPMGGKVVELGYLFRETERGVLPSERVPVAGATVLSPPLHPRCRCTLVADIPDA